jgi:hypothetical protein
MKKDLVNSDDFLVLLDGKMASEHLGFAEALRVGLKLRREHPQSEVKVRENEPSGQAANAIH